MRGRLISVEGIDGAGKTTLLEGVARALEERGLAVERLREPGSDPLSEQLRTAVQKLDIAVDPRAEALVYAAARAQLTASRLRPLLEGGALVLLDRFVDSSLAYQGGGRELGIEAIRSINRFATGGLLPDRTLLIDLPPAAALSRLPKEGRDRVERSGLQFFERVASAYRTVAARHAPRAGALRHSGSDLRVWPLCAS